MKKLYLINTNMDCESFGILQTAAGRLLRYKDVELSEDAGLPVTVKIDSLMKEGCYSIEADGEKVTLTAAENYTVYAAFGRFILESRCDGKGLSEFYEGKLEFAQRDPVRGMYFATHFRNFFHVAPIELVYETIQDLALIGCNAILVWFDMHHYNDMQDERAQAMVKRLRSIIEYSNKIGLSGSLTMLSNEAFATSPAELRAEWLPNERYKAKIVGHYHVEICPNKEGGIEEIIRERREMLEAFRGLKIKYFSYWPYDQGGCTCEKCSPWGANGYLKLLPYIQDVIKEYFPEAEVFVSTWYFDKFIDGEWDAFYPHLSDGTVKGVKKIMSFFHSGKLPNPIEKYGFPEGYDFIDFPEISMHLCAPWGGFGANPLPGFMNQAASNAGKHYRGGFPYSEGIWEDINKYMCLYRYTGMSDDANDAVNAYVRYYFNLEGAQNEELSDAIKKTEVGLARRIVKNSLSTVGAPENIPSVMDAAPDNIPANADSKGKNVNGNNATLSVIPPEDIALQRCANPIQYPIIDTSEVRYCYDVLQKYNKILPERITSDFRFRLIYLRTVIDRELMLNNFYPSGSDFCQQCLKELYSMYYCDELSSQNVTPPVGV